MEVPFDLMLQPQRKKFAENSWWGAQAKAPGEAAPTGKGNTVGSQGRGGARAPPRGQRRHRNCSHLQPSTREQVKTRTPPRKGGDFRTRRGGSVLPGLALSAWREMSSLDRVVGGRGKQDCHESAFSQGEPLARAAISHESKEFRSVRGLEGSVNEGQAAETATSGSPVRPDTSDLPPVK